MSKQKSALESLETIDQLNRRFQELDRERTRVHARLDDTKASLEKLLVQAEASFGTRDLEQLESQLKQLEAQNDLKRQQYQQALDAIERKLAAIDSEFVDPDLDSGAPAG